MGVTLIYYTLKGYITDDKRVYGFEFANFEIKFKVTQNLLTVTEVIML